MHLRSVARVPLEGSAVINREDWGVNWDAPLETGGTRNFPLRSC